MADRARVVVRHIIMLLCFWLPASRRKKIERWLRGREEYQKLQRSDWVLMSWGKSGRTWLRVMLSRAYQLKSGLDASDLIRLFAWQESDFEENTRGSAIHRIGYECWLRNIAVGLGNAPTTAAIISALRSRQAHPSELVREHVDWALRQHVE